MMLVLRAATYPRGTLFACLRCLHRWRTKRGSDDKPKACAKCKSAYWDKPPQRVPHSYKVS